MKRRLITATIKVRDELVTVTTDMPAGGKASDEFGTIDQLKNAPDMQHVCESFYDDAQPPTDNPQLPRTIDPLLGG